MTALNRRAAALGIVALIGGSADARPKIRIQGASRVFPGVADGARHPLFGLNASMERKNGDFALFWGEYLIVLPLAGGPWRRLDLRAFSESRSEFAGLAL